MATRVRAECDDCGIVRVDIDDCTLVRIVSSPVSNPGTTTTAFPCPMCAKRCVAPTAPEAALLLAQTGVEMLDLARPEELDDPVRHDAGDGTVGRLSLSPEWYAELQRL
ncbi:MAG: hypothetical protein JWL83_4172 [Actinomycetia bacterium]|nr:hypothetical protein [Actinomycetes bacterium]